MLLSNAWNVLYHAQRHRRLAVAGPYARIRHPQYVGFVLILGFLLQWPTPTSPAASVIASTWTPSGYDGGSGGIAALRGDALPLAILEAMRAGQIGGQGRTKGLLRQSRLVYVNIATPWTHEFGFRQRHCPTQRTVLCLI